MNKSLIDYDTFVVVLFSETEATERALEQYLSSSIRFIQVMFFSSSHGKILDIQWVVHVCKKRIEHDLVISCLSWIRIDKYVGGKIFPQAKPEFPLSPMNN